MKDFDTARNERLQRERTFRIGGQEFSYRPAVAPEDLIAWDQRHDKVGQEFLAVIDETVLAFLEAGQEEKWREARRRDARNPVNINDIVDVIAWLFEEQVGRPTGPPSASTNGHEESRPPLTPVSSSPAIPAG